MIRRLFRPHSVWHRQLLLITALAVVNGVSAQESEPSDAEVFTTRIVALEAEIERYADDIERLEARLEAADGLAATVFTARLDRAELSLLDTTIRLARAVDDAREDGLDVSEYEDDVAGFLNTLPASAIEAAARIHDRMRIVEQPSTPGDAILADQQLALEAAEIDEIFAALVAYLEVAPQYGLETGEQRAEIVDLLNDSAANRSVLLEIANIEAAKLRSAVATLSSDEQLTAWLSAIDARAAVASEALESSVELMNLLDLDTLHYRRQVLAATGEITRDVLDVGFMTNLLGEWSTTATELLSTQAPRFLFSVVLAALVLLAFLQMSKVLQKAVAKTLTHERVQVSGLLRRMILNTVRNLVIIIGVLVALSQVGISLGPLLAGLGIAGFVIGFALQDSLSNFASGLMILFYRPFDVGDFVDVAGVKGKVDNMSMVNTTLLTIDNQKLVVPNNMIWQSVIANYTDQSTRRVDLTFGISYTDDIDNAETVIADVLKNYDRILEDPAPVIKVAELADSSVNIIVRPWVLTEHYWDTYWDITKLVKQAFDREGITIPFPQRDVHYITPQPELVDNQETASKT